MKRQKKYSFVVISLEISLLIVAAFSSFQAFASHDPAEILALKNQCAVANNDPSGHGSGSSVANNPFEEFFKAHLPTGIPRTPEYFQLATEILNELDQRRQRYHINGQSAFNLIQSTEAANDIPFHTKTGLANVITGWATKNGWFPNYSGIKESVIENAMHLGIPFESIIEARVAKREPEIIRSINTCLSVLDSPRFWDNLTNGIYDYISDPATTSARRRFYRDIGEGTLGEIKPYDRALLFTALRGTINQHGGASEFKKNPENYRQLLRANMATVLKRSFELNDRHGDLSQRKANPLDEGDAHQQLLGLGIEVKAAGDGVYEHLSVFKESHGSNGKSGDDVAADLVGYMSNINTHIIAEVKPNATESFKNLSQSLMQLETTGQYLRAKEGENSRLMNLLFVHDVGKRDAEGHMEFPGGYYEKNGILYRQDKTIVKLNGAAVTVLKLKRE